MTPTQIIIREEILRRLAAGESLRAICRDEGFPTEAAVRMWARTETEPDGFGSQYACARQLGYERLADEILEISDDATQDTEYGENGPKADHEWISRSRLRVDSRKWLLSKMLPKVYGDKLTTELTGLDGGPVVVENVVVPNHDPIAASQTYMNVMDPK